MMKMQKDNNEIQFQNNRTNGYKIRVDNGQVSFLFDKWLDISSLCNFASLWISKTQHFRWQHLEKWVANILAEVVPYIISTPIAKAGALMDRLI